jgi:hypothetical protein
MEGFTYVIPLLRLSSMGLTSQAASSNNIAPKIDNNKRGHLKVFFIYTNLGEMNPILPSFI